MGNLQSSRWQISRAAKKNRPFFAGLLLCCSAALPLPGPRTRRWMPCPGAVLRAPSTRDPRWLSAGGDFPQKQTPFIDERSSCACQRALFTDAEGLCIDQQRWRIDARWPWTDARGSAIELRVVLVGCAWILALRSCQRKGPADGVMPLPAAPPSLPSTVARSVHSYPRCHPHATPRQRKLRGRCSARPAPPSECRSTGEASVGSPHRPLHPSCSAANPRPAHRRRRLPMFRRPRRVQGSRAGCIGVPPRCPVSAGRSSFRAHRA